MKQARKVATRHAGQGTESHRNALLDTSRFLDSHSFIVCKPIQIMPIAMITCAKRPKPRNFCVDSKGMARIKKPIKMENAK
jgi:hypothetical protein